MSSGPEQAYLDRRSARVRAFWVAALITVVWAWICVPKVIQTLLSPKYRSSVGVESAPYSRLAGIADYALYIAVIAVCVLIIIGYLNEVNTSALGRLLVMIVPWAYIGVRDLYVPKRMLEEGICYILIILAIWFLRPRIAQLQTVGYLMGLTALVSVLIALVLPAQAIFRTAVGDVIVGDKQILPGGILVGIFTQGNSLGQFLALGLPTIFLVRRRWIRVAIVALAGLAIVWSASRGAMIAVGAGAVAYCLIRVCRPWLRRVVVPVLVLIPFVAACVVPLITTTPDAFTNRGLVWTVSLHAWQNDPWFGFGSDWYRRVGSTSSRIAGSVFHGHNQFVQFMVTGGIIFGILVLPLLFVATARATRLAMRYQLFGATWLVVLGGNCLLEKSFAFVDNANFVVATVVPLAVLVLGSDLDLAEPDQARSASLHEDLTPTPVRT